MPLCRVGLLLLFLWLASYLPCIHHCLRGLHLKRRVCTKTAIGDAARPGGEVSVANGGSAGKR